VLGYFNIGGGAYGLAFDGANIWVANGVELWKLRASDGTNLAVFTALGGGSGVAFDGANIWVALADKNTVLKF
jgi:hypothetical protein